MVWPLLVAVIFGSLFGGGGRGPSRLAIAITDDDQTPASKAFVDGLAGARGLRRAPDRRRPRRATSSVGAARIGAIRVPKGFGDASGHLFFGTSPKVELRIDPSRQAETAMLQGFLLEQAGRRMQALFASTRREPRHRRRHARRRAEGSRPAPSPARTSLQSMLGSLDTFLGEQARAQATAPAAQTAPANTWQPLEIEVSSIVAPARRPGQRLPDHLPAGHAVGHPRLHDVVRGEPRRRALARHADASADVAGAVVGAPRRQGPRLLHGDHDRPDRADGDRRARSSACGRRRCRC